MNGIHVEIKIEEMFKEQILQARQTVLSLRAL